MTDRAGSVPAAKPASDRALVAQMQTIWTDLGQMREQCWKPMTAYSIVLGIIAFAVSSGSDGGRSSGIDPWLANGFPVVAGVVLVVIALLGMKMTKRHNKRMSEKLSHLSKIERQLNLENPWEKETRSDAQLRPTVGRLIEWTYMGLAILASFIVLVFLLRLGVLAVGSVWQL
jgi:hypothetical protein